MAKSKADLPHATDAKDFQRLKRVVSIVEGKARNDPYQATRYPIEDSSGLPIRYGTMSTNLPACSLNPVNVNEYTVLLNASGQPTHRMPLLDAGGSVVQFKVVENFGTALAGGQWVACAHYYGEFWTPIAAHCGLLCTTGTTTVCGGAIPSCPPGTTPTCQNGQWVCLPSP